MYDVIIIGCGVIGAATAYALSKTNCSVLVLEAENDVASGTTKANSAILHAGFDPEPGTMMARLNVRGVALAKEICQKLDVPYRQCGSLVVATTESEMGVLKELLERGIQNGVPGLEILTGEKLRHKEPNLSKNTIAALWAPTAAIVSPWEYALAMAECSVMNGAVLKRNARVIGITRREDHWEVHTKEESFCGQFVINAAGIASETIHNMVATSSFHITPTRGQYYILDKNEGNRVSSVVFPCPTKEGKGVLVAPTVHGNCIVGPSAEPVQGDDTSNTSMGLISVAAAARRIVPEVDLRASIRNFAGVRANSDRGDFIIEFAAPGFLDLAGIKSPGLSAAAAIGEEAVRMLKEQGLYVEYNSHFVSHRRRVRFKELTAEEKNALIQENPQYGRVICRCETITEGEILDCLHTPIPPVSVDGVKRRCNAGMGRCQGGFCGPRILEILSRELGVSPTKIPQEHNGSNIILQMTKQEDR